MLLLLGHLVASLQLLQASCLLVKAGSTSVNTGMDVLQTWPAGQLASWPPAGSPPGHLARPAGGLPVAGPGLLLLALSSPKYTALALALIPNNCWTNLVQMLQS